MWTLWIVWMVLTRHSETTSIGHLLTISFEVYFIYTMLHILLLHCSVFFMCSLYVCVYIIFLNVFL